ncbi:hypothetical protein HV221_02270 [Citrobacter freundii]|uniref:Rap1a/Tai family immunity protein n=1 Tax=Citrobacter freundii TaxID=546 RepID=UPI0015E8F7ED|nr:Rap1a/Tai family immunity protein [Citrobacter freundii]QLX92059.1 hypothetical protein HV221_02270 [Citrobacter freundii]
MKKTLLVIMLALLSHTARAEMDGNKLYETALAYERVQDSRGRGADTLQAGVFMGYVMGVSEYGQVVKTLCYPNNFINSQAFDLVLNYLKSKPEKRTDPSLLIVINALKSAFACP